MRFIAVLLCVLALYTPSSRADDNSSRVFAAASLTNALTDIASAWQHAGHATPVLDFSSSGTLAKQIDAGAPADLFASADLKWMDFLDQHGKIDHASRANLLGTTLVLIEPLDQNIKVDTQREFPIANAFTGKLCTADTETVPAGIYAKQALQSLGWWPALQDRIAGSDDVRTALSFVERGECALGIVYATDAKISTKVRVVAEFPADSHTPIVYPFALLNGARDDAHGFLTYLSTPASTAVFEHYGFTVLPH